MSLTKDDQHAPEEVFSHVPPLEGLIMLVSTMMTELDDRNLGTCHDSIRMEKREGATEEVDHLRQSVAHTDPSLAAVVAGCRRVSRSHRRIS